MSKPADSFSYHLVDQVEVVRFPASSGESLERSPSTPSPTARDRKFQFQLIALFPITALLSIFFASIRMFGVDGAPVVGDVVVLCIGIANILQIRYACGMRIPKVTVAEFGVLLFVCFVLHGLTLPAVQSNCHRRGAAGAPTTATGPTNGNP